MKAKLIKYFENFLTDNRKELFNKVIDFRTRYITVVLEDIFQPHNASAVLRTCDCFGIQDVHIIENNNKYQINPDVTLGSDKWLTIFKYSGEKSNTVNAIAELKKCGYRIIATMPYENDRLLENYDLNKGKAAFLFGTELSGLSKDAVDMADEFVKIPMVGFTQSFNISVSAAIILYHLTSQLRKSSINWSLTEEERTDLLLQWYKNSINKADLIEKEFYTRK